MYVNVCERQTDRQADKQRQTLRLTETLPTGRQTLTLRQIPTERDRDWD